MTKNYDAPCITEASCEFWFEPSENWQDNTLSTIENAIRTKFPEPSSPTIWFDRNFLAVTANPFTCDWEEYLRTIQDALAVYREISKPQIQSVYLYYVIDLVETHFSQNKWVYSHSGRVGTVNRRISSKQFVSDTPEDLLKMWLKPLPASNFWDHHERLQIDYLFTQPSAVSVKDPMPWLRDVHSRMEEAFCQLRSGK